MLLFTHIVIALGSLGFTTYLYFSPNKTKFNISYILVAGTLVSGTVLVIASHSPLMSSCLSGLAYLAAVSFGIVMAHRKFQAKTINVEKL